jgi:Zn-dependent membrane protease YugP
MPLKESVSGHRVPVGAVSGAEEGHEGQHEGHAGVRVEHLHLVPEVAMLNSNLGPMLWFLNIFAEKIAKNGVFDSKQS